MAIISQNRGFVNADRAYDKISFDVKIDLLMNHFVDMAVQGYGWVGMTA